MVILLFPEGTSSLVNPLRPVPGARSWRRLGFIWELCGSRRPSILSSAQSHTM